MKESEAKKIPLNRKIRITPKNENHPKFDCIVKYHMRGGKGLVVSAEPDKTFGILYKDIDSWWLIV